MDAVKPNASSILDIIAHKFVLDLSARSPIELPMSRWDGFPEFLRDLGYGHGAEIGVEEGVYSERLCKKIPYLSLHSIDAWLHYPGYRDHVSQEKLDRFYETAKARLLRYRVDVIRMKSVDAAPFFDDHSLDFVYIDGNHEFLHVTQDIAAWEPKVRRGGIVAGHDFRRDKNGQYQCHVKDVVQAWTYAHGIRPWFVLRGDKSPSWFWVKA